jgi:pimeloyl-ACP methyl ester carboxylesterase
VGYLDDVEASAATLDVRAACERLGTPTLLVHGLEDASVDPSESRLLHEAFRPSISRLHTIAGTGHTFGAVHPYQGETPELAEAMRHSLQFLSRHLDAGRGPETTADE